MVRLLHQGTGAEAVPGRRGDDGDLPEIGAVGGPATRLELGEHRARRGSPRIPRGEDDPAGRRSRDRRDVRPGRRRGACARRRRRPDPGTATYRLPAAPSGGYTLMGSPTVIADFTLASAELPGRRAAARRRAGRKRRPWSPVGSGGRKVGPKPVRQVFQLHADGCRFEPGHIAMVELIPTDTPYGRTSTGQQPMTVSRLQLRLPVLERPGAAEGFVKAPALKVVPQGLPAGRRFQAAAQSGRQAPPHSQAEWRPAAGLGPLPEGLERLQPGRHPRPRARQERQAPGGDSPPHPYRRRQDQARDRPPPWLGDAPPANRSPPTGPDLDQDR